MERKTLNALKKSIKHWELNARRKAANAVIGPSSCALCRLFNNDGTPGDDLCRGCPVYARTGYVFCLGTPFLKAHEARYCGDTAWRAAARKEVAFLKSLLPEAE